MNKFLIMYKMQRYVYMNGSKIDQDWNLVFIVAESQEEALNKLKLKKEFSDRFGDSDIVYEHEFVETIE